MVWSIWFLESCVRYFHRIFFIFSSLFFRSEKMRRLKRPSDANAAQSHQRDPTFVTPPLSPPPLYTFFCVALHGIAWFWMVLDGIPWYCMILNVIAWYSTWSHICHSSPTLQHIWRQIFHLTSLYLLENPVFTKNSIKSLFTFTFTTPGFIIVILKSLKPLNEVEQKHVFCFMINPEYL